MASNLIEIGTDPSSPTSDVPGSEDVAQAGLAAAHHALDEATDSPKAKVSAVATTLGFSAGDSDTEAQEDADDAVDNVSKAASDVKSAVEDKAVVQQQQQDAMSPKAELSNEDVIASFLGANDSADSANDSSIAHHDAIVIGDANDKDIDGGATTEKGTDDGPQSSGAEDEDDKPAEPASAKIKRLSSFFETTPSEPGFGPIKSAVPVGKIKHSFGGGSEAGSFQSGSSSSRMSLNGVDKSQTLGVTVEVTDKDKINTVNVFKVIEAAEFAKKPLVDFIPYEELVRLRIEDGIDATRKEDYLTEEEFVTVFGYDRESYTGMPRWKQQQAKRSVNLF